jgi:putative serine protease PepD
MTVPVTRALAPVLACGALALGACTATTPPAPTAAPGTTRPTVCDATAVAASVLPSVVTITAGNATGAMTGSGEVVRADGYILTNNHVVAPAAAGGALQVRFSDGASVPATIVGRDVATDLAVVRVNTGAPLPVIAFGTSSDVRMGEPVIAAGAPLGLSSSLSTGIVSALERTVHVPAENGQVAVLLSAVQTDAALNPGNSGGALVDCSGALIGVPTAIASVSTPTSTPSVGGSIGIGFAIPVDLARTVGDELIATGVVSHSYFGLEVAEIPPSTPGQDTHSAGLSVTAVDPAGPAARAGLLVGDVITAVAGAPALTATQLALLTITTKPGETVGLTYVRGGVHTDVTLTLTAPPAA